MRRNGSGIKTNKMSKKLKDMWTRNKAKTRQYRKSRKRKNKMIVKVIVNESTEFRLQRKMDSHAK